MSRRALSKTVFAVACLGLLVAPLACAAPAAREGCALVTQADAEEVFGAPVKRGTRGAGRPSSCDWKVKAPLGVVTIDVIDAAAARGTKGTKPSVPGLGDDAFFLMNGKPTAVLTVIKGNLAITISVSFPMGRPSKVTDLGEAAKEFAGRALARF